MQVREQFQTSSGANDAAFLAKFSGAGSRVWSTYFAGDYSDYAMDIALSRSNDIFITGVTKSLSDLATSGAYQTSNGGGYSDGFITKFSNSGIRIWCSYYGGDEQDYGSGIIVDSSGNAFITGATFSTSGIATKGAYKTAFGGGGNEDAFLAKFSKDGTKLLWGTYYGGTDLEAGSGISFG